MSSNKFIDEIVEGLGSRSSISSRDSLINQIAGTESVAEEESRKQAESEKELVKRLPKSVFKGGMKPEDFYGGSGTMGILHGLYLNPAQAAEAGMSGMGPKALFNELGEPVDETGKPFHLTQKEWDAERAKVRGLTKGPELVTTPEYTKRQPEYRHRPIGDETFKEKIFGSSLSNKAKAQALVKLMANEEGIPLNEYRQGPHLLNYAARGFVENFIPANFALYAKEALEGMEPDMPETASENIAYHLGSLAGFVQTAKMFAGPMVSPVTNFLQVGSKAPVFHRIISESLRDAALIGTASGLLALPKSLEETTFTGAAGSVLKSVGSGALIGTIFGTSRGMFPNETIAQKASRIATGLVGLNAMRAAEVGGNPFTDRPVGEVIFDTLLDTFFLWRGMSAERFDEFDKKISNLFARRTEVHLKEKEVRDSTMDEAVKQAQLKVLEVQKNQLDLELARELKSANFEAMVKHDLSGKGGRVQQIKGPKKYSYDEAIDRAMRGIKEEEVPKAIETKEDLVEKVVEPEEKVSKAKVVNIENAREGTFRDAVINEFNNTPIELRDTPEFKKQTRILEQIKDLESKLEDKVTDKDDKLLKLWERFNKLGEKLSTKGAKKPSKPKLTLVEPKESITDVDLSTGTKEPELLSTDKSPFRDRAIKRVSKLGKLYEERAKNVESNVEMKTAKLINDVNRYLNGEDLDIGRSRDELSNLATRTDEFRHLFGRVEDFKHWENTVSDAAEWARKAERSKIKRTEPSTTQLNMMIPLNEVPQAVKDFLGKVRDMRRLPILRFRDLYRNTDIWKETGYWIGRDGKWRYELDDSEATISSDMFLPGVDDVIYSLKDIYKHPTLYIAVPEINDTKIKRVSYEPGAYYEPEIDTIVIGTGNENYRTTIAHEVQHAINNKLDSFVGSSVDYEMHKERLAQFLDILRKAREVTISSNVREMIDSKISDIEANMAAGSIYNITTERLQSIRDTLISLGEQEAASKVGIIHVDLDRMYDRYMLVPGEIEARVAARRVYKSSDYRERVPPWEDVTEMLRDEGYLRGGLKLYSGIPIDEIKKSWDKVTEKLRSISNIKSRKGKAIQYGEGPFHGTDIDNLRSILRDGLKPGSSLDYNKDWIDEYPVVVTVPSAEKGKYISHNDYFVSKGEPAKVTRVTIDLEHYIPIKENEIRNEIAEIAKEFPNVKFTILNESESPYISKYSPEDVIEISDKLTELYKRRNPDIDRINNEISELENKFKTPEGYIKNMDKESKEKREKLREDLEFIKKNEVREIRLLESKLRRAEEEVDYELLHRSFSYPLSGGAKLYSGVPLDKIHEKIKPFYSKLEQVIKNKLGGKIEEFQLRSMLKNAGVTEAEIENVIGGLKGRGKLTKQEILDEIKANTTEFEDVVLRRYGEDEITPEERANIQPNQLPQFSGYVEPGAVSGSYREMFVTAPNISRATSMTVGEFADLTSGNQSDILNTIKATGSIPAGKYRDRMYWQDGHDAYSDIQNPIVRIRYNERELPISREKFDDMFDKGVVSQSDYYNRIANNNMPLGRFLFIEEMQGPSSDNQSKMPDYLQKRIYDIGVKRIIALAKEQGFDGVAWTTGEMQARRYRLSNHISSLVVTQTADGRYSIRGGTENIPNTLIRFNISEEELPRYIGEELTDRVLKDIRSQGDNKLRDELRDKIDKISVELANINKNTLEGVLRAGLLYYDRAELENKLGLMRPVAEIRGVDLDIGGEGLKDVYDVRLPSLFKKYGKEGVGKTSIAVGSKESDETRYLIIKENGVPYSEAETLEEAKRFISTNNLVGATIEPYRPMVTSFESIPYTSITNKTPSQFTFYSGFPLDKAAQMVVDASKRFAKSVEEARGIKRFKPGEAYRLTRNEFVRAVVDKSGNIRRDMLDKLSDDGYRIIQKMYLQKGASSLAAQMLKQMNKEIYSGLSSKEKVVLDKLILSQRLLDIAKYKTKKEFVFPKGQSPEEAAAYSEFFMVHEELTDKQAENIRARASSYFEWMKKPLKDLLDAGLISKEEYDNLSSHNYRRIKLVDVFDKRYEAKVGKHKMTVYDSGVQRLAHGRSTDIFEPSSEIMALEVFNRAYGRVLKNQANMELLNLARKDPNNPFVRTKEGKSKIPSGWDRIFVFEEGQRKALYLSPDMSKEWITSNPEVSYGLSKVLRYVSGSPVLRTFATGINWGFALANMPRDIMHAWFAARTFENGKWKPVYNSTFPVFAMQMARDQATVFFDALLRKGRYLDYIKEGGGMEFLVHQGRLFQRGRHLGGPMDSVLDFLGYLGETSEIMTRLAIRERVIRKGKSPQEATFAARDYMDFGQGGGIAKAADNAFPYLNAAIQGTRGLVRSFKDNPMLSTYKLAQFGAAVVGSYIASYIFNPETFKALKGDIAMRNNMCIPLGDRFGFIDSKGQKRYMYLKFPLDPGQKFFKTFFEAATDKWLGNEVDVDTVVGALKETSPVGISELPPSISSVLGYINNKDFWLNEDIWKKTDKPFSWPQSKEEYIPGKTPQALIDFGNVTGLSPERTKQALQELFTNGTMWSYLVGKGYDYLFSDLSEDMSEMHMAEVLAKVPVIRRFFGITNPYSQYAKLLSSVKESSEVDRWIQDRGLDLRTEGYLYQNNVTRSEVEDYMRSFKDEKVYDRLSSRFEFQKAIKDLPNRSFWLSLKGISDTEARARAYVDRLEKSNPEEAEQLRHEYAIVYAAGGVISEEFEDEVARLRGKSVR